MANGAGAISTVTPSVGALASFVPASVLDERMMEEERQARLYQEAMNTGLMGHVRKQWERARDTKRATTTNGPSLEEQMFREYRQRNGEYDPDKLSKLRRLVGSVVFMHLTGTKIRAATAWINDVLTQGRPWDIEPTPNPELSADQELAINQQVSLELMQWIEMTQSVPTPQEAILRADNLREEVSRMLRAQAKEISRRMGDEIEDRFVEGKFMRALREAIDDLATTKAGIIKGPVVRRKKRMSWDAAGGGLLIQEKNVLEYERASPMDIYPMPETRCFQTGGFFHRHVMIPAQLSEMIGQDGYDDEAIRRVLQDHKSGYLTEWLYVDQQRANIEQRPRGGYFAQSHQFDALEYYDKVPGRLLNEWSRGRMQLDPEKFYDANIWLVGKEVIYAKINYHPLGIRPYGKASYEEIPGAFWGRGIAELIRDVQMVCNAVARAVVNNVGIASGPQTVVNDVNRLPPGFDIESIYPWKVWPSARDKVGQSQTRPAVEFFQPSMIADQLTNVYEFFSKLADDYTIPGFAHGDTNVGGAGNTASGLSMFLGQASKMLRDALGHIDEGLIKSMVEQTFVWTMLHHPDDTIKGDVQVKAKAMLSLTQKEQVQVRRQEFLGATNNPLDTQIMGMKGRGSLLRELAQTLDMDPDKLVPEEEELEALDRMMGRMGSPPGGMQLTQPVAPPRAVGPGGEVAGGADQQRIGSGRVAS